MTLFQHRRLSRARDAVVIDATEPRWHYASLPEGRMREGFASLKRAHVIFISKCNLASTEDVRYLETTILESLRATGKSIPIYELVSSIDSFARLVFPPESDADERLAVPPGRLLLVSGIGRPSSFADLVRASGGQVVDQMIFADHHSYTESDFASIEDRALELHVDSIVVTEKDAVKMAEWNAKKPVFVSHLGIRSRKDMGAFYEDVSRLLR